MRIALLPSAYAPAVGGVEELTARLAHRFEGAGDNIEVWTNRHPPDLPADESVDGIRVRRFPMPMPRMSVRALASFPFQARRAWSTLVAAAAEFRPEIIHVQCFSTNGVYGTELARHLKVPLVLTLQGETVMDNADIYEHSLALRLSLRRALDRAAAVTACSGFVLADAETRFALSPGRGTVIPNGVELDENAVEESLDLPFTRFVFGVGRVVEKKGFDLLLDAFRRVAPNRRDLGLVIGGSGPARDGLVRSAADAGLSDRVAFPGSLSRGEIAWAMSNAAVFVLPSRVEPFGIVVVEALRAGCPAVVSIHGGAPEIVRDGVDGIVVDPSDAVALAAAIDCVLDDEDLAKRLRLAGPPRAAAFDWETIAGLYHGLYDRARPLNRQPPAQPAF